MPKIKVRPKANNLLSSLVDRWRSPRLKGAIARETRDTIKQSFEQEQTPEGRAMKPLKPATIQRKLRKNQSLKKLKATGEGQRSLKVRIQGDTIVISYRRYMEYHQSRKPRTGRLPRRQFAPDRDDFKVDSKFGKRLRKVVKAFLVG